MGNPDLERHNPVPDPRYRRRQRRQDLGTACTVAAIAVTILVTIGFWSITADGTIIRSLHRLLFTWIGGGANTLEFADPFLHSVGGSGDSDQEKTYRCAIDNLHKNTSFLHGVQGIATQEFLQRRDILARVLDDEGIDAFIVEPGFTFE
ncbi:hypothetical protein NQ176_g11363 [Zarea fungicola]|uniref:Uncharacterized protein n=1 Tax=Zarea fungicola TaxID=93591 RepID=A0ACC1MBH0_9HYPO|nr:hypothetical protein NQ176_g11363 [Lecanicillium fungicola]